MEVDDDGERERQEGDAAMSGRQGSQSLLMKNIMRLVVAGSIIAVVVNVLVLLG